MYLRQSTASQEIKLGPFLDTAGDAVTGLTIANTDILLTKGGATTESAKNSGGATHVAAGRYTATLDATDTDTVGILEVDVHASGALPVKRTYQVVEEAVYDALFAASAPGYVANAPVNVAQISGDSTAADNAEAFFDGTGYANIKNQPYVHAGTCGSAGGSQSIVLDAGASGLDDFYAGNWIVTTGGTGVGQARLIASYNGTTKVCTVYPAVITNTQTDTTFAILPASEILRTRHLVGLQQKTANVDDASATTSAFDTTLTEATGHWDDAQIVFTDGTLAGQSRVIDSYSNTGGRVTLDEPLTSAPTATDPFAILSVHTHTKTQLAAAVLEAFGGTSGTVEDHASNSTTQFQTNLAETADDYYIGNVVAFTSGTNQTQVRRITDYVGSTGTVTVSPAFDAEPDAADEFVILGRIN